MGDMAEDFRAMKVRKTNHRRENMEKALLEKEKAPFTWQLFTPYHWIVDIPFPSGGRLQYWPSTNKFRYKEVTRYVNKDEPINRFVVHALLDHWAYEYQGTAKSIHETEGLQELIDFAPDYWDDLVFLCSECDWWVEPGELNEGDICGDCFDER